MNWNPTIQDMERLRRMALAYMQKLLALQGKERRHFNGCNILDEIRITAGLLHDYEIIIQRKSHETH